MQIELTRRDFLAGASAAAVAVSASASFSRRNDDALTEFDYGSVQLTPGPFKDQYDRIRAAYLNLDNDRLLKVYRERAGLPAPGEPMDGWYGRDGFVPGHALGQYISGLARFGRTTGDSACMTKVGALVEGFAATLGPKNHCFAGSNAESVWPCYILDKHLAGLMDAFNLAGVKQAHDLIQRVFYGAMPFIPDRGRDRVGKKDPPYDETYILPESLFQAYELTGEQSFHDRALAYLLDREYFDPLAGGEDALPGRHAYSHVIALSSAGKARRVLGDDKYLRAMQNAWNLLQSTQQFATGGWGPNETFITPHHGQLFESLSTTNDHFETPCGSYAAIKLARYLICATGDARYGDGLERILLNGLLAVKEPDSDGDYPYYSTYGAHAQKIFYPRKWPCCSGTLVEGVADYVKSIYFRANDGIAVTLFIPSQVRWEENGTQIVLTQETGFPLRESVTLRIACAAPQTFALKIRIPGWIKTAPAFRVNGRLAHTDLQRGFAVLRRRWSDGDSLKFELPQQFYSSAIDDLHPETVAVLRGPVVYVEVNPNDRETKHTDLGALRASNEMHGAFESGSISHPRIYAPFYAVHEEIYTMYSLLK